MSYLYNIDIITSILTQLFILYFHIIVLNPFHRSIYKKRADLPPQIGSPQEFPKRIRFVLDISGSMYRFNGQDQRLERLLLTTLMIMEAFQGFEYKYQFSIVGHSGGKLSNRITYLSIYLSNLSIYHCIILIPLSIDLLIYFKSQTAQK